MEMAATKVYLPKPLKRRAFAAFAMAETNFSRWARENLERWLQDRGTTEATSPINHRSFTSHEGIQPHARN
jgi:hypothetical protein